MSNTFSPTLPIAMGADHAGFIYKQAVIKYLNDKKILVADFGTYSLSSTDYPDYAHAVANSVAINESACGILFCGSANGVAITANKHKNIRAGLCWNNDVARLVRMHNNANIICIPSRFVALELAIEMVDNFLNTSFEGGRHQWRIDKIPC